jgi:hypothetical protein
MSQSKYIKNLTLDEINQVCGGDAFSSGFDGAMLGSGVGSLGATGAALLQGASWARWGAIGGIAGALVGFTAGVAVAMVSP